ncbi:MAG: hypothetical protein IKD89_01600 [Clostridia bacterium]|nr:hypothetical protein [Clostridia bacterium]
MKQILLSCIGTTDPVRGEHDGPMLHILRYYRPESAWLIFTPEMRELAMKDGRFERTLEWISAHWNGYRPDFRYEELSVRNAHDIDALDIPIHEVMTRLARENHDAEILVNVTSGTPQMQMILSQLVTDIRYRAKGIQVINFEKGAGRSQRANHSEYDIELELECNEDELPEAENRCVEPEMYAIRRQFLRRQIVTLLDDRNFEALEKLKESLPENVRALTMHLAARSRLREKPAKQLADEVKGLPFKLYAYKTGSRREYSDASEYYLMMKNLVKTGNYTQFLLHLEPLTLTLQLAQLDRLLNKTGGEIDKFISRERRRLFYPDRLKDVRPDLYRHYEKIMNERRWEIKQNEASTMLCDDLISFFPDVPPRSRSLFAHYAGLKDLRNRLAHTLVTVTEEEIKDACGITSDKLLKEIEDVIRICYPACDPVIFGVYDECIEYIKSVI